MRILLAEDDRALGQALADGLRQLGHVVDWITDGTQAAAALSDTAYAAAILDWNLPRSSGPAIIAGMRRRQDATPVLLLTARDELADRVAGLDAGADDYVVKPVHLDELAARLRALLRRADGQIEPAIRLGSLEVTPAARSATLAGAALELTAREYALLEYLMRRPGQVVSKTELLDHVWDASIDTAPNAVEVYVGYLRRKLGRDALETVRGAGYRLRTA